MDDLSLDTNGNLAEKSLAGLEKIKVLETNRSKYIL
jgi:hypothetical protein